MGIEDICPFFKNLTDIPIKTPASYFVDMDKLTLKFIGRDQRLGIANTILKEKKKAGGLTLLNNLSYYKATVIKKVQYKWKNRSIEQNRESKSRHNKHNQLLFDKGGMVIQWRKVFPTNRAQITGHPHPKINLDTELTYIKINSKWATDLNIKYKTPKR